MSTGRTVSRWGRIYVAGRDLSGDTRSIGPLGMMQETEDMEGLDWAVKAGLPGQSIITIGALNSMLNSDGAAQMHDLFNTPGSNYAVMIPIGIRAAPAQGDPVFCAQVNELGYTGEVGLNSLAMNLNFGGKPASLALNHKKPWGTLLRPKLATAGPNSSAGGVDNGAASAFGGFFMYQVFAGDGTAILSVDDSANGSDYAALSGATSGSIDCSTPKAGIIQLATNAAVRQHLRWQLELETATTVTAAWAFVRSSSHNV
ncbi:MAG: hypothetical protein AAGU32_16410 [Bacillota bacterium]